MNRRRATGFLILSLLIASALVASSGYYTATAAPTGAPSAQAAPGATGAIISGEIERIAITTRTDHWSGGTIQVGGQNVILPRNLLIDLPANRVTLKELFDQAPAACVALGQTGLAKADACNNSLTGGFATIHANTTNAGNVIAGDVFIAKGVEAVTGAVTYINYDEGYYRLSGDPASPTTTGVMVRLNDPDGRHTEQQGAGCVAGSPNCSPDPRFTLDPDNYTNAFTTGYPYCIPSTVPRTFADVLGLGVTTAQASADGNGDVLCPQTNRPAAGSAADSRRFAPIKLGDTITAEGNFEIVNGVQFLSAHSTMVMSGLTTSQLPGQPDYMFLDEVEIDMPAFQNQRIRTLIIGYTTFAPADVMIWSLHYDPATNTAHEFPLATAQGCEAADGPGQCASLGLAVNGSDIFRIRHDVDFGAGARFRLNPCAHLQNDPRMGTGFCPNGGGTELATPAVIGDQVGILSPIPHEIQARTGRKFASLQPGGTPLITLDIRGNEATNGQYLFPFGIGLGGLAPVEPVEFDLNAVNMPFYFSGLPWALDRRLSPAGCIDTDGNGSVDCEANPQPLDPFPFEGRDPRTQAALPTTAFNDANFTASALSNVRNRIFSFVSPALGRFNGDATVLAWPPADPAHIAIAPTVPVILANASPVAFPDSAEGLAGAPVTVQVLANDTDPDGDVLTVTAVGATTPANAGTVVNNGNSVTFTANAPFTSAASFTYTIFDGRRGTSSSMVTVTPANPPPVANAGLDQAVQPSTLVTLDGRGSTGTITGYSWAQTAGTPVTLAGANTAVATFTAPNVDGPLTFTLTATGPGGPPSVDTTIVTVLATPPVANAGPDVNAQQGTLVTLNGQSSTGTITGYTWVQTAGTLVTLTGANTQVATFTAPNVEGPLTFSLTASGPAGPPTTDTIIVTVLPPPPVANAGVDQTVQQSTTVTLDGRGSVGGITSYSWVQTVGTPPVILTGGNTAVATFTAPNVGGTLSFTLTAAGLGGSSVDTINVTVLPSAPVANAGPDQQVAQGKLVALDGSVTTGATGFAWQQTGGQPAVTLAGANTAAPTFTFPDQSASLTFQLTATNAGGTSTDTVVITAIPDAITITKADFLVATGQWVVTGTSSMPGPTTITIYLGNTVPGATVVGTTTVDALGNWSFSGVGPAPDATRLISVGSSRGGHVLGFPVP